MSTWIKDPLAILAEGAERGVVVSGGRIVELVPRGAEPVTRYAEKFEARRHVVLPGLINTHHHFYQTLTRAMPAAIDRRNASFSMAVRMQTLSARSSREIALTRKPRLFTSANSAATKKLLANMKKATMIPRISIHSSIPRC